MTNAKTIVYIVISLVILIVLFLVFVLPDNIPQRNYTGPGSPFVHPPGG